MAHLLVTGASGHLGASIVRDLHAHRHTSRSLVRAASDRRGLAGTGTEIAEGDLLDRGSIIAAITGCDGVIHAGAVHRTAARDPGEILAPSIEGTRNVIAAAATAKVRRVVHCSSNATIGYGQTDAPLDEASSLADPQATYIRAKVDAERVALASGAGLDVEVVVVNPCGILGPWDLKITPTTKAVIDIVNGGPCVLHLSLTHVADVAAGHRLAWEHGVPGQRYLLAGEPAKNDRIAAAMSELLGRDVRAMSVPRALLWVMAFVQETRFAWGGAEPDITRAVLADVGPSGHLMYDAGKARRELGWTSRPLEEVLQDTLRWLAHQGRITGAVGDALRARWPADPDWPRMA